MAERERCEMVPVVGTVVAVGPVELAPYDTTYESVVIRDEAGTLRDFAMVGAVPEISGVPTKNLIPMIEVKNLGMMRLNDHDLDTAPVPPRS